VIGVSVVVPARDAGATLGACLDGLAAEGVPGPEAELLIVDDGSVDDTSQVAAREGVTVLRAGGKGPAAARNLGAQVAGGDVLIFLDADTVPRAGWLREMVAPFEQPDVVAVKGRYFSRQTGPIARFAQLEFEEKYDRLASAPRVDFVDSGTAAYRRDAFRSAGGFDEGFSMPSAEDVELAFRLATKGARFVFNPEASVWHSHADSLKRYLVKKAGYGYFRVRVYRRYPSKAMGDSYTPPAMGLQIALAGLAGVLATLAVLRVRWAGRALGATLGLFGATTLPLTRRAVAAAPEIAPLVPALVFARSWAQGLGILAGLLALAGERARGGSDAGVSGYGAAGDGEPK
jgi:cellulose synthase/poly-beta-1,6-N-acetylglucosamine synthase-like glycosyltransferase